MAIRRAKPTDARGIAEAHVASWQTSYRGIFPDSFLDRLPKDSWEAYWMDPITKGKSNLLVFEQGDSVIGFSSFGPSRYDDVDPKTVGEIYAFYFDPQYWGRGYISLLPAETLNLLREQEYSKIILWVLNENQRAIQFYKKLGFKYDGTQKKDTWKVSITLRERRYQLMI